MASMTTRRLSGKTSREDHRDARRTPRNVTLLNLVAELSTEECERDVIAAVMDLINTRQVTLIGQVLEKDIKGSTTRSSSSPRRSSDQGAGMRPPNGTKKAR